MFKTLCSVTSVSFVLGKASGGVPKFLITLDINADILQSNASRRCRFLTNLSSMVTGAAGFMQSSALSLPALRLPHVRQIQFQGRDVLHGLHSTSFTCSRSPFQRLSGQRLQGRPLSPCECPRLAQVKRQSASVILRFL